MSNKNLRMERKRQKQAQQRRQRIGITLIGIGVLIFLVAGFMQTNRPAKPLAGSAVLARGQQLFEQNCAACHGVDGEGHVLPEAPALNGSEHAWHHPDGVLQRTILDGGQIMPGFREQLTLEDSAAIVRYIQTWWKGSQVASQQSLSGQDPMQP